MPESNETELDPNAVSQSLLNQLSAKCIDIARLEAVIDAMNKKIAEQEQVIDKLMKEEGNGKVQEANVREAPPARKAG